MKPISLILLSVGCTFLLVPLNGKLRIPFSPTDRPSHWFQADSVHFFDDSVSLEVLKRQQIVRIVKPNDTGVDWNSGYEVVSYTYMRYRPDFGSVRIKITGNSLLGVRSELKAARAGDFVQFSDIQIKTPEGFLDEASQVSAFLY